MRHSRARQSPSRRVDKLCGWLGANRDDQTGVIRLDFLFYDLIFLIS